MDQLDKKEEVTLSARRVEYIDLSTPSKLVFQARSEGFDGEEEGEDDVIAKPISINPIAPPESSSRIGVVDALVSEPSLRGYITSQFQKIRTSVGSLSSSDSDSGVQDFLSSCSSLEEALIGEADRLERESVDTESATEEGGTVSEITRERGVFKNYVETVLPKRTDPLTPLIAYPHVVSLANQAYVGAQPSLPKKEKAKRIAALTAKVALTLAFVGIGATLCVISAGIAIPVIATVVTTSMGIACTASLGGVSALSGLGMGIYSFFSTKGHGFGSKEQKEARQISNEALSFSKSVVRV